MQNKIASAIGWSLRSITAVPHIIRKYPLPFLVLCFKALLSVSATLSQDLLTIIYPAILGGNYYGVFLAWFTQVRLTYGFWLALPIDHPYVPDFLGEWYFIPTPSAILLVLLIKLPMIAADTLSGLLIYKIVLMRIGSHRTAYNAFRVWFYNPIVTLLAEMFGSIDIVATMLMLACIYYFMRNRLVLSSILFLVAVVVRVYPLLILPVLMIKLYERQEARRRNMVTLIAITVLPTVALAIILTLVTRGSFLLGVTVGPTDYWFFLGPLLNPLFLSLDQPIALTIALYVLVLLVFYDNRTRNAQYREDLSRGNDVTSCVFMILLALFAFSHWNPQFLLWILPFATLDYGLRKSSGRLLFSFIVTASIWTIIYHGFYYSSWGNSFFFIPNSHPIMIQLSQWLYGLRGYGIIQQTYLLVILKSMFTGVCILYLSVKYVALTFPTKSALTRIEISRDEASQRVDYRKTPLPKRSKSDRRVERSTNRNAE